MTLMPSLNDVKFWSFSYFKRLSKSTAANATSKESAGKNKKKPEAFAPGL
jgi:hypothetical protein